jgi:predicted CoA-binding protein
MMKTVAIIGASNDRAKFGNKAVRAFLRRGYTVFPVNPKETIIEGLSAFRNLGEIPARPNLVSVYLPPPVLLKILPDIAAKGCDELWLNPGTESAEVLALAEQLKLNVIQACSIVGLGLSPDGV